MAVLGSDSYLSMDPSSVFDTAPAVEMDGATGSTGYTDPAGNWLWGSAPVPDPAAAAANTLFGGTVDQLQQAINRGLSNVFGNTPQTAPSGQAVTGPTALVAPPIYKSSVTPASIVRPGPATGKSSMPLYLLIGAAALLVVLVLVMRK